MVRIERVRRIAATPAAVWAVLADYPNVFQWAPMVQASRQVSPRPTGLGAARACAVPGFGELVETVDGWEEGRGFSYSWIASGPVKSGRTVWEVEAGGDAAVVRVTVVAEMRFGPLGWLLGQTVLKAQMGNILRDTLAGLEHYVRTGEIVDGAVARRLGLKAA